MSNLIQFRPARPKQQEQVQPVVLPPAPAPAPTRVKLCDGKVVLYKRPNYKNDYWQYAIPIGKGFEKKSTKTSDLEKAKKIAVDRYQEVCWLQERGMSAHPSTFEAAALAWIEASEREIALGGKHVQLKTHISLTKKHIIPFFGKKLLSTITQSDIHAYHAHYLQKWQQQDFTKLHPKKPSATSMSNHEHITMRICKHALEQKVITHAEMPVFKFTRAPLPKRGSFTKGEFDRLLAHLEARISATNNREHQHGRKLLYLYIKFLNETSMRPGVEPLLVRFCDVEKKLGEGDDCYATVKVRDGKMGSRNVICSIDVLTIVEQLQAMFVDAKRNDPIFGIPEAEAMQHTRFQRIFAEILEELGMDKDAAGLSRSMYSVRHYSITQKMLRGQDKSILARNCGTSTDMIEKHYFDVVLEKEYKQLIK